MSIKALQDYTFTSKYARYNAAKKRRSTWNESIDRVQDMHISRFPQIEDDIRWAFTQSKAKRVLGSQRALQYAGDPILKKHARIYNCTVSYVDRVRFFQEALWLLLCGCGTGFSVQTHHIAKLPDFHSFRIEGKKLPTKTHYIEDSIEGWADALGILIATYMPHEEFSSWAGKNVDFDPSFVRPKGATLSSGAGKAPGPEPLMVALAAIRDLLESCLVQGFTRLRSVDAYDIVMHASDSVLSGGVRRSASICVFSPDDELMARAKTGNWFTENPQRGRSNNSALLIRNKTTQKQFHNLMLSVKEFGEPGFVWADSTEILFNPCVEIGLYPVDVTTGISGWAFCNLCEINGRKCKTEEDFRIAAKAGAIIGTLQAAYTDFPYLGEVSERIAQREALLGVSITGMMDSPVVLFDPEIQRRTATYIVEVNKEFAAKIGINQAARCTAIKPSGSTSLVLGTSSGIHAHHSKRYIRRIQANVLEAPYQFYATKNPRAVELSVWSKNGTDSVVSFCVETSEGSRTRKDMDAISLLQHVKLTQDNWIKSGKVTELCTQPYLSHNVSNTITVRDEEWKVVEDYIYHNRSSFAGVSLLSDRGDLDYPQAPFTSIHTPSEIVKMYGDGAIMASGIIVDGQHAFSGNLWDACNTLLNFESVSDSISDNPIKLDWIRRAKQFSTRYFLGDLRNMTFCLKEVDNFKLWCDLNRENIEVDFSEMLEETDETRIQDTVACAGGQCEL